MQHEQLRQTQINFVLGKDLQTEYSKIKESAPVKLSMLKNERVMREDMDSNETWLCRIFFVLCKYFSRQISPCKISYYLFFGLPKFWPVKHYQTQYFSPCVFWRKISYCLFFCYEKKWYINCCKVKRFSFRRHIFLSFSYIFQNCCLLCWFA